MPVVNNEEPILLDEDDDDDTPDASTSSSRTAGAATSSVPSSKAVVTDSVSAEKFLPERSNGAADGQNSSAPLNSLQNFDVRPIFPNMAVASNGVPSATIGGGLPISTVASIGKTLASSTGPAWSGNVPVLVNSQVPPNYFPFCPPLATVHSMMAGLDMNSLALFASQLLPLLTGSANMTPTNMARTTGVLPNFNLDGFAGLGGMSAGGHSPGQTVAGPPNLGGFNRGGQTTGSFTTGAQTSVPQSAGNTMPGNLGIPMSGSQNVGGLMMGQLDPNGPSTQECSMGSSTLIPLAGRPFYATKNFKLSGQGMSRQEVSFSFDPQQRHSKTNASGDGFSTGSRSSLAPLSMIPMLIDTDSEEMSDTESSISRCSATSKDWSDHSLAGHKKHSRADNADLHSRAHSDDRGGRKRQRRSPLKLKRYNDMVNLPASSEPAKYACHRCLFVTRSRPAFEGHLTKEFRKVAPVAVTKTGEPMRQRCGFCSFSTFLLEEFEEHVLTHTVDKPFQCGYCAYSGFTKKSVQSHHHRHHRDQPQLINETSRLSMIAKKASAKVTVRLDPIIRLTDIMRLSPAATERLRKKYDIEHIDINF